MSETTGPKTWGDVIEFVEYANRSPAYYGVKGTGIRSESIAVIAHDVSMKGIYNCACNKNIDVEVLRLVLRWLSLNCPPLADPIPPEADEPVTKTVRWEPTKEDAERIIDECNRVADDMNDCREEATVLIDAIRDCQRDLPEVEPPMPPTDRIVSLESRLAALESRLAAPTPVTPPATVDGWQTEPPNECCFCWIRVPSGEQRLVVWHPRPGYATELCDPDTRYGKGEIERYWPVFEPTTQPSPNPIGRSAYNTPTSFEEALTVEPPVEPEPEIPLPKGCTEIEGFPLLCRDGDDSICTRERIFDLFSLGENEVANMEALGISNRSIKQAAHYAIEQIARDAGLSVVVK